MGKDGAPFVLANHNSKLDSLMITGLLPPYISSRMRSLIKLALFNEPLFGGICHSVGHFPVYFKGNAAGAFCCYLQVSSLSLSSDLSFC